MSTFADFQKTEYEHVAEATPTVFHRCEFDKGFPHGMPTTRAETINADLLAFFKG